MLLVSTLQKTAPENSGWCRGTSSIVIPHLHRYCALIIFYDERIRHTRGQAERTERKSGVYYLCSGNSPLPIQGHYVCVYTIGW
jgi:hypothetical protein